MGKTCRKGLEEALMYGYDVSCEVEFKPKKGVIRKSTINFYQHPDYQTALLYSIADEKLDINEKRIFEYSFDGLPYPLENMEDVEEVLGHLEYHGFTFGKVI